MLTIVVPKETRNKEKRVAAIPETVASMTCDGYKVRVEAGAGAEIGFSDNDYRNAGAEIFKVAKDNKVKDLTALFSDADVIIRIKRANRAREVIENAVIPEGVIIIGFLDPLDEDTPHVQEWTDQLFTTFSMDLLAIPVDDPMNVLAPMSDIAGHRSVIHALEELETVNKQKAVILGVGTAGLAAIDEAHNQGFNEIIAVANSEQYKAMAIQIGATSFEIISGDLKSMMHQVASMVENADIVIASAVRKGKKAPVLIDDHTLETMKKGAVIIDLAKTEGGNVIGSVSDNVVIKGNGVKLALKTGYPKEEPEVASIAMAKGLELFIGFIKDINYDYSNDLIRSAWITKGGQKNPIIFGK